ncbi:MAG: DUF4832 domain-containing protein [Tunicatimonas sp.]
MTLIKHLVACLLLAQLLIGSALAQSTNTITYQADDSNFPNPERGWFVFKELKPTYATNANNWATAALLDTYYARGYRLVKHIIRIPTTSGDLPQDFLDKMSQEAALVRSKGMKIFYRFNYNWNHSVSNEDAPTDITVEHLEQLEPFFSENADIIAWMEMGFIGYWGEMHTSTSGHIVEKTVGLSDSGKKILYKALDVFPADRVIGVRYPQIIFRDPNEYGSLGFQTPLNEDNAYDGTYQSRLAGWYANFGAGEKLWHEDQEYATQWAPSTEFVPQWAHCDHFQDLTMDSYEWLDDAKKFHYVALSNPQDENHTYDIYERWVQDGVYDDYEKYLGYRYELVSSRLNAEVAPGEQLTVSLTVANQGWARPVNPRRVEVILRHPTTGEVWALEVTPSTDFRLWFPGAGQEKELAISLSVPDDTPAGAYEVLLNLPDPAPSLRDDPRYSVRLANQDTWEPETGYNQLNAILTVGGTADTPPVSVPTGEDVIIYNTNGSEDESAWTVVEDTPNNLDPTHMVLQNGLIRITYPALRGQPGTTGFTGNEKAAHLLHLKQGTEYVLAQDGDFGDWIYVGGSFTDDPTGFKIVENTSDRCKIVLEFDNHRMSAEDNSLNPCKKYVTLQKGHYGYTVFMEVEKASFGEYEAGFGGSASHLFTYSDRYGYRWKSSNPAPGGWNYQFLRREDQAEGSWWSAGVAFEQGYYRLVAIKPTTGPTPAFRAYQFKGGLTAGLIRYSWSDKFSDYETYIAAVPYNGADANSITVENNTAVVNVPQDGSYTIYSKIEELGPAEDRNNSGQQGDSRRYEIVAQDVNLKAGDNYVGVAETTLTDLVVVPVSNGINFPQDVAAIYQNDIAPENPTPPSVATYTIRARGLQGTEEMALLIGGETVQSWTVSKSLQNYTYTGGETGAVRVAITNDQGVNHDLVVNKLTVDGAEYLAKEQVINTGVWQKGSCGGTKSEWLHCSGYIEFDLNSVNARTQNVLTKPAGSVSEPYSEILLYPNPAQNTLHVRGNLSEILLSVRDQRGRLVQQQWMGGKNAIDISRLSPGLYVVSLESAERKVFRKLVKQ